MALGALPPWKWDTFQKFGFRGATTWVGVGSTPTIEQYNPLNTDPQI